MKNPHTFRLWTVSLIALAALTVAARSAKAQGCIAAYGNSSMGKILSLAEGIPMSDEERAEAQEKMHKLIVKTGRITEAGFTQYDVEEILRDGNRAGIFCSGRRNWRWLQVKRYLAREIETRQMETWIDSRLRAFEDERY